MSTNFPTSFDSYTPAASAATFQASMINDVQDAIIAIETKIGVNDSTVATSLDSKHPPVGAIVSHMGSTVPSGWLECDGSAVSQSTYSRLYGHLGGRFGSNGTNNTFNLPDMRGRFLRGWNHGSGNDPDAASRTDRGDGTTGDNVGTRQADELEAHTHTYYSIYGAGSNYGGWVSSTYRDIDAHSSSYGGAETRPVNIYGMYIIKY